MDFKYAIFDLDGTILDSMGYWRKYCIDFLIHNGEDLSDEAFREKILNTPGVFTEIQLYNEARSTKYSKLAALDFVQKKVKKAYKEEIPPKPFVLNYLKKLHDEKVKMCIATATPKDLFSSALKRLEISKYFDFAITIYDIGKDKNDPGIFDKSLKKLGGNKNNTIIFEDSLYSIKTAADNGYRVFAVSDYFSLPEKDEIKRLSEKYITTYKELLN